jgi:hypothetical protein
MAEPTEPKKETVRIAVTPPPAAKPTEARDTVRITLPSRPPTSAPLSPSSPPAAGTAPPPIAKPLIPPAPSKPVQPPRFIPPPVSAAAKTADAPSAQSSPMPTASPSMGPKKETARITVLPDPPAASSVKMKKTQPLINMPAPAVTPSAAPVTVASEPGTIVDSLPMGLCWGLVAVSTIVLLIQILNYIS